MSAAGEASGNAAANSGGQLVAHGPLQTLLPLPAASLSKVYSVMPPAPTKTPFSMRAGMAVRVS